MKILLIRPPGIYSDLKYPSGPRIGIPIGLLFIASSLKRNGYEVKVLDALVEFDYKKDKFLKVENGIYWGMGYGKIKEKIKEEKPDVVGISNNFHFFKESTIKIARICKKIDSKIVVILGGADVSVSYRQYFNLCDSIDYVVIGEGEYTMIKLLRELEKGKTGEFNINGIIYKENVNRKIPPMFVDVLDNLSFPSYDTILMEKYFELEKEGFFSRIKFQYKGSERAVSMITSRGCPYNCIFCSIHLHMGKKWRAHSPENIIGHIELLKSKYNIKHIHFEDDNFTFDNERVMKICNEFIENKINITWDTPNGVRVDSLNEESLKLMKKSGCTYLMIGIESSDEWVLNSIINKRANFSKIKEVIKICKKIRFDLGAFYVIGLPGEDINKINKTKRFAIKYFYEYGVRPHFNIAVPLMGTKLYEICKKNNYLKDSKNLKSKVKIPKNIIADQMIETPQFKVKDLVSIFQSYEKMFLYISIVNIFRILFWHPIAMGCVVLELIFAIIKNPTKLLKTLKNYYLGKFIFPNLIARKQKFFTSFTKF